MNKIKNITISILCIIGLTAIITGFDIQEVKQNQNYDVIILKLMGKKLESAYVIDDGVEDKVRGGLTGDEALEDYLVKGWEIKGTSVASDAGRFSVVYTLVRLN